MYSKNLNVRENELYIGSHKLQNIAKEFGTPLYVYDEDDLVSKMRLYKENFKSSSFDTLIVYASKAFLVPEMARLLKQEGLLMDAMSITDMEIARLAEYDFSHLVFHGNFKSNEELRYAIDNNVGYIVVDNLDELKRLIELATKREKKVKTLFRINPKIDAHTHEYVQTALNASKFGESYDDEKVIKQIMNLYLDNEYVELLGFHAHIGSQIKEVEPYELLVSKMMTFQKEISLKYHINLPVINFGGGFGIEYFEGDEKLDLPKTLQKLIQKIELIKQKLDLKVEKVMIEPGRSIVGPAGITLYECGITKKTGSKNFLFINGGMTDNIRPALYHAKYHACFVNNVDDEKKELVDIVGKCCESGDFIIKDAKLPKSKSGDILAVFATGAYTYSMNVQYNGHMKPAVIFIGKNNIRIVSKKQKIENIMTYFKKNI